MKHFNVRVYGIWINEKNEILLSDERIGDFCFTKFPGGGLEFGEGIRECLIREWKEELNADIDVLDHIYTTDFFQLSAFDQQAQIISVYYYVQPRHDLTGIPLAIKQFDFSFKGREEQQFRLIPLKYFSDLDLTLPIDKKVAKLITK